MTHSLNPSHSVIINYVVNEKSNFHAKFIKTILDLEWTITQVETNIIKSQLPISLSSWGESIEIELFEEHAEIKSLCIGNQLIDWGKNKKNISDFLEKLNHNNELETQNPASDFLADEIKTNTFSILEKKKSVRDYLSIFIPNKDYLITPILIYLNILVFIIMAIDGTGIINSDPEKLIKWGANYRELTLNGELWRLISCMFIHIGIVHLIMNLYALIFIGSLLEPIIGKSKFITVYLVTGIIASTSSLWWNMFALSAGASGAIFGLFGIFLALLTTNYLEKSIRLNLLKYILIYIVLNIVYGFKDGIDAAAHLGGLFSGIIIGYFICYSLFNKNNKEIAYWTIGIISFLGIACSILVIEKIPNPIKKYYVDEDSGGELNYFTLYENKMKDFEINESLALEVINNRYSSKEKFLLDINEVGIYYWNLNLKTVYEIQHYSLPNEVLERNNLLIKYCKLRIKSYQLIFKKVKAGKEETKYDKELIEINQEIEYLVNSII